MAGERWKPASGSPLVLAVGQASRGSLLHHICLGVFLDSLDLGQKEALEINRFQCFYRAFGGFPAPPPPKLSLSISLNFQLHVLRDWTLGVLGWSECLVSGQDVTGGC